MHIKDIYLTPDWQKFSDLVEVNDLPYSLTNTTSSVMFVVESAGIPSNEGVIVVPAGISVVYTPGAQDFYLKGTTNNRVTVYQEG